MQFISTTLQTFIMQIISTIPLCNYKVPVITTTTKTSHSALVNHGKTFQTFSRTYIQNSRTFKDFPGQKKKSRTFPGCGNPVIYVTTTETNNGDRKWIKYNSRKCNAGKRHKLQRLSHLVRNLKFLHSKL